MTAAEPPYVRRLEGKVAFFASDDSSFVTGQLICCGGGMLAHQPFLAEMPGS